MVQHKQARHMGLIKRVGTRLLGCMECRISNSCGLVAIRRTVANLATICLRVTFQGMPGAF